MQNVEVFLRNPSPLFAPCFVVLVLYFVSVAPPSSQCAANFVSGKPRDPDGARDEGIEGITQLVIPSSPPVMSDSSKNWRFQLCDSRRLRVTQESGALCCQRGAPKLAVHS